MSARPPCTARYASILRAKSRRTRPSGGSDGFWLDMTAQTQRQDIDPIRTTTHLPEVMYERLKGTLESGRREDLSAQFQPWMA
jgi:hypothetical protein